MNWPDDYINQVVQGDSLSVLRQMPDGVIQTCITSPPYWGLRDYGTATWEGGDPECDHQPPDDAGGTNKPTAGQRQHAGRYSGPACYKCGATRIDDQIGLERTPELYVEKIVEVFREVRRVLRDDGTLWLNLGDSYVGGGRAGNNPEYKQKHTNFGKVQNMSTYTGPSPIPLGLKPKDLVGIPWMVAFALRSDGWYLRSDIIWHKPNPMPESVTDRPTKAHEYLFLLAKSQKYYYDADAIREPLQESSIERWKNPNFGTQDKRDQDKAHPERQRTKMLRGHLDMPSGRNKRSVWTIATQPFKEAHFATFPIKLIEPCILAGSGETACGVCGAPWKRVVEKTDSIQANAKGSRFNSGKTGARDGGERTQQGERYESKTTGLRPTCDHNDNTGRSIVLDPFMGSGTVGLRSKELGRQWVGIELNEEYTKIANQRLCQNELSLTCSATERRGE